MVEKSGCRLNDREYSFIHKSLPPKKSYEVKMALGEVGMSLPW